MPDLLSDGFATITGTVRFAVEGWHCWPEAPMRRAYLRSPHRHMFHVEVGVSLSHRDRDIEFHDLLDFCRAAFPGGDMGRQSVEDMAVGLLARLVDAWPGRAFSVAVFEDGENGATVAFFPTRDPSGLRFPPAGSAFGGEGASGSAAGGE